MVDDDNCGRDALENSLAKAGYRVVTASCAEKALGLAQEVRPAAVLFEMFMPGRGGWGLLSALKADPAFADIPVLPISLRQGGQRVCAPSTGDFTNRPPSPESLARILKKHPRAARR